MADTSERDSEKRALREAPPQKYRYVFTFSRRRQKTLLTLLVGLVVVTFVLGFGGAFLTMFSPDYVAEGDRVGTLFGKPVSRDEFRQAQSDAYLQLTLGMGLRADSTPTFGTLRRRLAWRRLASLRHARDMGITTGDREVHEALQQQFTDRQGVFNQQAYENFMTRTLPNMSLSVADFLEYLRSSLTLVKLEQIIGSSALVAPYELSREMARYTDSFTVNILSLPDVGSAGDVPVSETEAREFFSKNSKRFMVPDKVRVKYVTFPVSNFLAQVQAAADDRAREYYREHLGEFAAVSNAAGAPSFDAVRQDILNRILAERATNYYEDHRSEFVVAGTGAVEAVRPFPEVQARIADTLRREDAATLAEEKAAGFASRLNPGAEGVLIPFERAAAQAGLPVATSAFFGRFEEVAGLGVSLTFNRDAFDLAPGDPRDHYSSPIRGSEAVYVLGIDQKRPRHVPDFADVSNRVYRLAKEEKRQKLAAEKAASVRVALQAAVKGGKTIADAAREAGVSATAAGPFTWLTPPTNATVSQALMENVSHCQTGEFTPPVAGTNGMLIAYVAARTPGDPTVGKSFASYLGDSVREERAKRTFAEWQMALVADQKMPGEEADEAQDTNAPPSEVEDGPPIP